jgi:hypothetical protein
MAGGGERKYQNNIWRKISSVKKKNVIIIFSRGPRAHCACCSAAWRRATLAPSLARASRGCSRCRRARAVHNIAARRKSKRRHQSGENGGISGGVKIGGEGVKMAAEEISEK